MDNAKVTVGKMAGNGTKLYQQSFFTATCLQEEQMSVLLENALDEAVKSVNFIKSAFLSIHVKIFCVMKWEICIKNCCCSVTTYNSVSRKPRTVSTLRCELNSLLLSPWNLAFT